MTAQIAVHGRLGRDPRAIDTSSGKPMATASLAVTVEARVSGETGEGTLWLDVLTFGRVADDLTRHAKGDMVSISGRLQLARYTNRDGETRENWQCIADSLVSAKSVHPRGGARTAGGGTAPSSKGQRTVWPTSGSGGPTTPEPPPHVDADLPFDDPIPFGEP